MRLMLACCLQRGWYPAPRRLNSLSGFGPAPSLGQVGIDHGDSLQKWLLWCTLVFMEPALFSRDAIDQLQHAAENADSRWSAMMIMQKANGIGGIYRRRDLRARPTSQPH